MKNITLTNLTTLLALTSLCIALSSFCAAPLSHFPQKDKKQEQEANRHIPAYAAITKQNNEQLQSLLEHKADPNTHYFKVAHGDTRAESLIFAAVELNNTRAVELLLEHKADPDAPESIYGKTPLSIVWFLTLDFSMARINPEIARLIRLAGGTYDEKLKRKKINPAILAAIDKADAERRKQGLSELPGALPVGWLPESCILS